MDRVEAGRLLGQRLAALKRVDPEVLALPRGDVPRRYRRRFSRDLQRLGETLLSRAGKWAKRQRAGLVDRAPHRARARRHVAQRALRPTASLESTA